MLMPRLPPIYTRGPLTPLPFLRVILAGGRGQTRGGLSQVGGWARELKAKEISMQWGTWGREGGAPNPSAWPAQPARVTPLSSGRSTAPS